MVYLDNKVNKCTRLNERKSCFMYKPVDKVLGEDLFREERLGHKAKRDFSKLFELVDSAMDKECDITSVRVVGTEEFMYTPIKVAEYIEKKYGVDVICHSTTRSPIDVMKGKTYGCADAITSKNIVPSVYEEDRVTHLYNLDEVTDLVLFITDGSLDNETALGYYELFKDKARIIKFYAL